MKEFYCLCENLIQVDFPDEVNVTENPDTFDRILSGDFMSVTCERCGKVLKPEFPVRIVNSDRSFDCFLIPEMERSAYLLGKVTYNYPSVVIGYAELAERIRIFRASLDPGAIEIVKFYMLEKLKADEEVTIAFHEVKDNSLVFYINGLKDGEIGVKLIPFSFYEKVLKSLPEKLNEEPFSEILKPPYISVKKIAFEEDEL